MIRTFLLCLTLALPAVCLAQWAAADASAAAQSGSLGEFVQRLGRAPDASEDGGACGGIMIHEWHAEGLRVISQGDQVQQVTRIPAGTAD
ncbi:MAG: hypothetical protein R3E83_18180 [Burkholderiaceae bacterium]